MELLVETFETRIQGRLLYYAHAIDLNEDDRLAIAQQLQASVPALAASVVEHDAVSDFSTDKLPSGIEEKLQQLIEVHCGAEAIEEIREDERLREDFRHRTVVNSVLARLDPGLALSQSQHEQIRARLESGWDSTGFDYASPAYARSLPHAGLPTEDIAQILTPRQQAYWSKCSQESPARFNLWYASDDAGRLEEFQPELEAAFAHRIGVLGDSFDLSPEQVEKLRVLTARYREELLQIRMAAYEDVYAARDHGRPPNDSPSIGRANMMASALLGSEGQWSGYVARVLEGEEREEYFTLTQARNALHHAAASYHMARTYRRWGNLDGKQVNRLCEVCVESIPVDTNWTRGDRGMYFAVFELPELSADGFLNDQQLRAIRFRIDNLQRLHELLDNLESADDN